MYEVRYVWKHDGMFVKLVNAYKRREQSPAFEAGLLC
jgi:hypothetical protein